jgi:nucleoside-diphosphate-sugar epimerase
MTRDCIQDFKASGILSKDFVYAAICPTMVIGPRLSHPTDPSRVPGTMGSLQRWLKGAKSIAPNDSMSFTYVQDCAKMHTRILQLKAEEINEHQRYMSLVESIHWNDILALFKELYPNLPEYTIYQGEDKVKPTVFNFKNMKSLGVSQKSTREALEESIHYLIQIGALD